MFIKAIKNQRGDTIIEVMIALSVLMVIIVGGYSIATRSLNGVRIAQERSEASKIAEGQLEAINERIAAAGGNSYGRRHCCWRSGHHSDEDGVFWFVEFHRGSVCGDVRCRRRHVPYGSGAKGRRHGR